MTTPKSHRPFSQWLREAVVDRADTWINGPDDDDGPWMLEATVTKEWVGFDAADADLPALKGSDDPDGIVFTADGTMTIPIPKVTPNVLDEPPGMTCATHGPGCPNLALERELVDLEWTIANAPALGHAEAVKAWNRGEL